jgi:integrase
MQSAITIRTVKDLPPGTALWDTTVQGFGCRRQRGAPVYVLKYRIAGRQRFFTIGPHGSPWTPDTARKEARRLLGLVATGSDPADAKSAAALAAADTLGRVIDEYLRHVETHRRKRTIVEVTRYLRVVWQPLHRLPASAVTRRHITARVAEVAAAQGTVTASRARASLSAMFNWAIREGLDIPANPVQGTNKPAPAPSRERVLSTADLRVLLRTLNGDRYSDVIRMLLLTGQRRQEIGALRWSEVEGDVIRLPAERTKNKQPHTVPLSPAALAVLDRRRSASVSEFVFGLSTLPFNNWGEHKSALDRRIAASGEVLTPWVLHDLRRTCATGLAELGVLPHIVEAVLNHVSGHRAGVAGTYNRARYSAEVRDALCRWADHIAALVAQ